MPGVRAFVDTNVLLYTRARRSIEKGKTARDWLRALATRQAARINLQVLNELAYVLLRKKWFDTAETAYALVDEFAVFGDSPLTWTEIQRARSIHRRFDYSWWDCLLLASAIELGCSHFLSEDLQDGQKIEGLTIVDPFAHTPEHILVSRQD